MVRQANEGGRKPPRIRLLLGCFMFPLTQHTHDRRISVTVALRSPVAVDRDPSRGWFGVAVLDPVLCARTKEG